MPRQNERVTYLTEVDLEFASGRRTGRISDISLGGCYVEAIVQVSPGERFSFDVNSIDGTAMRFEGEVAYVFDGMGFGVKFVNLNDDKQAFLNKIIADRS